MTSFYVYEKQYEPEGDDNMNEYNELTHEDKQEALDEAHEIMKSNEEKLNDIKSYVNGAKGKRTTPILRVDELNWLIEQAERVQKLEKKYGELVDKNNFHVDKANENLARYKFSEVENKRLREAFEELKKRAMNVSPDREEDGSIIEDTESRFLHEFCESVLNG